jgi:phage gpG-like protein
MAKTPVRSGEIGVEVKVDRLAVTRLKKRLDNLAAIPKLVFAQGRIEQLLLERTRGRFEISGQTAQKDPSGRRWKPRSPETRSTGFSPILVRSGTLRDAITIVRSNLRSEVATSSPTGAGARIGVPVTSKAAEYARAHQFGTRNSGVNRSVTIPQRRFLGVGDGEVKAVDRLINQIATEQLFKR